ncbi:hypothetical protein [Streptomyces sp. NPDC056921]|uniref:hypothetical protein n=1 Tax=Streptomyces sp. NPDC056921 TaxID=3345966 RepID=UPI0036365929
MAGEVDVLCLDDERRGVSVPYQREESRVAESGGGVIGLPTLLAACADRGVVVEDAEEMVALAAAGRPDVADVFRGAAVNAGRVLTVDPECIVVCGEPAALDELVLAPIREQLAALSLPAAPRTVEVRGSALSGDAAALGGVALLLRTTGQELAGLLDDRSVPGDATEDGSPLVTGASR